MICRDAVKPPHYESDTRKAKRRRNGSRRLYREALLAKRAHRSCQSHTGPRVIASINLQARVLGSSTIRHDTQHAPTPPRYRLPSCPARQSLSIPTEELGLQLLDIALMHLTVNAYFFRNSYQQRVAKRAGRLVSTNRKSSRKKVFVSSSNRRLLQSWAKKMSCVRNTNPRQTQRVEKLYRFPFCSPQVHLTE